MKKFIYRALSLVVYAILLTVLILASTNAYADIDLSQCVINNQLAVCNQSLEKAQEVVAVEVVEEKQDKMTLEEFIITLVEMVEERNSEEGIVVTSSFETDAYNSVLIENQNNMKCVNGICAKEKEWK